MAFFVPQSKDISIRGSIQSAINSIGPYDASNLPPLPERIAENIKGYDKTEFIDDMYDFLSGYQKKTGEFKDFTFNASFADVIPGKNEGNSLRYEIEERRYARGAKGIEDPRWMIRDVLEDSNQPGYSVLVYTKQFENIIKFTSWSKNYRDADRFADKIEDMIDTYGRIFKMKGLNELRFLKRAGDVHIEQQNYSWYGCPLVYLVKTIKVKLVYEKLLEEMAIEIALQSN